MAGLKDAAQLAFTGADITGLDASGGDSSKALPNTPCIISRIWTRMGSGTEADPYLFHFWGDPETPEISNVKINWNGISATHDTEPGYNRLQPGDLITNSPTIVNGTGFAIFVETLHGTTS